ncbi:MAG: TolC family protein [Bacteroidales bacterium]|nr:TolC family protein [Bacteroidales bacterium]
MRKISKRRIIGCAAVVMMLLYGSVMCAQTDTTKLMRLSLSEAQQYALEHNYTLKNASLDVQKAEAARWESISSMLPQLTGSFDYSNMLGYEMNMNGFSIPMNPNGTYGLTAAVALTGAQVVGAMLSKVSLDMANISRRQSIQTIYSNVKNIYVSILAMEETVGLLDSSLANVERLEKTTQDAVRVGAAEQIDADKLSVQVASLRNSILSTRRALQMLYNSMLLQLGAGVDTELELTTPVSELLNIENCTQMLSRGFDINNNFNYQTLQQGEKAAKQQVTLAWMNYTPTVSVYYQYSKRTYFGKEEGFNMTPPQMLGAQVSLPLWKSGSRIASVKQAKVSYQETLNSKQQAEDGLRIQYQQLSYDLISALESYQVQSKNLDVSKRVFDNLTEKYKYGRATSLEITNASTDIITAQSNYIEAVMNVISSQIALENLLSEEQYDNVVLPGEKEK